MTDEEIIKLCEAAARAGAEAAFNAMMLTFEPDEEIDAQARACIKRRIAVLENSVPANMAKTAENRIRLAAFIKLAELARPAGEAPSPPSRRSP